MENYTAIPCQKCIENTKIPYDPNPCENCIKNCYCKNDNKWICRFCLNIVGYVLKSQDITEYIKNFPCYCSGKNNIDYLFLCLDCQEDYCTCPNKKIYVGKNDRLYYCHFCFEKEYNQIIKLAEKKDFPIK